MPNSRLKKRRLTPNATEKKVKTKRVRRDSDPCVSKSDSPSNKCEEEGSEDAYTTLTLKSVLSLSGDLENACLLFLAKGQRVCIKGLANVKVLIGVVNILGSNIGPEHEAVQIFSPSSSSLISLCEFSDAKIKLETKKRTLRETLQKQSSDLIQKAVKRAKKAATVLLISSLQTVETSFVSSFQCYEGIFNLDLDKSYALSSTELALKKRTAAQGFILLNPESRCNILMIPKEWKGIASSLQNADEDVPGEVNTPVVLICGGKDVGKSTFARYLTNFLLNSHKEIYFLECDVGQTEFTPPGLISLHKVGTPLFGPPFTHLRQPERSVFFGDNSSKDRPELYVRCIHDVYKTYADHYRGKIPLIVNTQGWVIGMGVNILLDVIRMVNPSHIIQLNYTSEESVNKNLPAITEEFLMNTPGWAFADDADDEIESVHKDQSDGTVNVDANERRSCSVSFKPVVLQIDSTSESKGPNPTTSKFSPRDQRSLALLAYFSRTITNNAITEAREVPPAVNVASLMSCIPYQVPWNCLAIHVIHSEVPWNQSLFSVNASVVGLAKMKSDEMHRIGDDNNTPYFVEKSPVAECIGLGIVRNIDPARKLLYVLTPLPLDRLQQVNALLKGNIEIPAAIMLSTKQANAPYVSSEFSFDVRGAGSRKIRYNLLRKSLTRAREHQMDDVRKNTVK